jgi:hypothetical protein
MERWQEKQMPLTQRVNGVGDVEKQQRQQQDPHQPFKLIVPALTAVFLRGDRNAHLVVDPDKVPAELFTALREYRRRRRGIAFRKFGDTVEGLFARAGQSTVKRGMPRPLTFGQTKSVNDATKAVAGKDIVGHCPKHNLTTEDLPWQKLPG